MKYAIVTGGSKNEYDAIATLVVNLTEVMPDLQTDYIIFHDGFTMSQQQRLQKYYPVKLFKYKAPISAVSALWCPSVRYFTPMLYCKYECLQLLDTYDKVIWTDYDVVFKEDVSDLFATDHEAVFVTNGKSKILDMFFQKHKEKALDKLGKEYDLYADAITTPLFLVSKGIGNYMKLYHWCNQATVELFRYLEQSEQAILSMMLQKYQIQYGELSNEIYALHPKYDNDRAKIIHTYGQPKFWNGYFDERWEKYHQIWKDFEQSL